MNSADWFATVSGQTFTSLGRDQRSGGDFYFNGLIDDVRIYDDVLSSAEVQAIVLAGGPIITTHPVSLTVDEPLPAIFTVVASGVMPLTYEWFIGGVGQGPGTDTLTIDPTDFATHSGTIRCAVTDDNTVTSLSGVAILTINDRVVPTITSMAVPPTVVKFTAYSHTFTATGYPTPTWSMDLPGSLPSGLTWDDVTGTISGTPDTVSTSVTITVTATNGSGSDAESFTIQVTGTAPNISVQPQDLTVDEGQDADFSITAGGTGALTYEWFVNTVSQGAPSGISTFTIASTTGAMDQDEIYCVVTNTDGGATLTSDIATLTVMVDEAPLITSASPPDGIEGVFYSHQFTATGYPAPTWSVTSGTLPPGMTLTAGGTLAGIPSAIGTYSSIEVTSTNGVGGAMIRRRSRWTSLAFWSRSSLTRRTTRLTRATAAPRP